MLVYRTAIKYELLKKNSKKILDQVQNDGFSGRSFCDSCGKQLSWQENIPIFSWILQNGKTKCCDKKLDWSYPLVELTMGILFVVYFAKMGYFPSLQMVIGLLILVFTFFSFIFDAKYMILPDFSTGILIILAILFNTFSNNFDIENILAGIIGFSFIGFLWWITKKKGMGFGDVKLAFFMGVLLGYRGLFLAFYAAFIFGALWGIGLMILKGKKMKAKLAFGPFLLFGTIISWCFGSIIKLW